MNCSGTTGQRTNCGSRRSGFPSFFRSLVLGVITLVPFDLLQARGSGTFALRKTDRQTGRQVGSDKLDDGGENPRPNQPIRNDAAIF